MPEALLTKDGAAFPCYLVDGEDPSLVAQELSTLLASLVELSVITTDAIEEYGDPAQLEELDVGAIVNACSTPPFLTATRVVVVRDATAFDAASQKEIAAYLADALPTTVLVLANPGRVPATLAKAVHAHGIVRSGSPNTSTMRPFASTTPRRHCSRTTSARTWPGSTASPRCWSPRTDRMRRCTRRSSSHF
jgi:hypothetical protein